MAIDGWITIAKAAQDNRVSQSTIRRYIKDGGIEFKRIGNTILVDRGALRHYIRWLRKPRKCRMCGREFVARRRDKVFCSSKCRSLYNVRKARGKLDATVAGLTAENQPANR